jgi:hypothetical protein
MCQLLLSGVGYVPTPNVHLDVWDCVESYTIHMLLACRLKITFTFSLKLILSFLVQLQHLLLTSLLVTSSQVRVGMPLPFLSCCISGLEPEGLLHSNNDNEHDNHSVKDGDNDGSADNDNKDKDDENGDGDGDNNKDDNDDEQCLQDKIVDNDINNYNNNNNNNHDDNNDDNK